MTRLLAPCAVAATLFAVCGPIGVRALGGGQQKSSSVPLPNTPSSLKFAVLGNSGTGEPAQYELAEQMSTLHQRFKFELVLLLGGNIQGSERPQDFLNKFEKPYKRLLDAGVRFHAVIGNDDSVEQRYYKHFNMDGRLQYTLEPSADIQFIALQSTYFGKEEIDWLEATLRDSQRRWKIVYLHHPPYSSGRRHGSHVALRKRLEPLFVKHNVSVVFTAGDAIYERTKPQNDITYFVVGSSGKLRQGDIDPSSGLTARGFDADHAFLAAEITGDQMHFNAVSRTGETVDSGVLTRRK